MWNVLQNNEFVLLYMQHSKSDFFFFYWVVCDNMCQPTVSNISAQKDPKARKERKASRWVPEFCSRLLQNATVPSNLANRF